MTPETEETLAGITALRLTTAAWHYEEGARVQPESRMSGQTLRHGALGSGSGWVIQGRLVARHSTPEWRQLCPLGTESGEDLVFTLVQKLKADRYGGEFPIQDHQ